MNPTTVIETAVKVILDEQYERAPCIDDRYFIGDTILKISEVLGLYGRPTIEMRNMSIEIGELTPEDCYAGHITLRSHDQGGRRDADSLSSITNHLHLTIPDNAEHPKPSEFGRTYDFDVCQACPAFITAICTVHDAGFTADSVHERAKAYWLATFGFWG
jgi:hypothetical protein